MFFLNQILPILCSTDEISVKYESQVEQLDNFMPRQIESKKISDERIDEKKSEKNFAYERLNFDDFLIKLNFTCMNILKL